MPAAGARAVLAGRGTGAFQWGAGAGEGARGRSTMNPKPPMRASRAGRWRALALVAVHALAALHIAHWLETGESLSPLEPSEAMEITKHGVVNAGLIFFGLTILSTLVLGRWFCGWACHLVALQDASLWLLTKFGLKPKPLESRLLRFVPALAAVYMFLWPVIERFTLGLGLPEAEVQLTKASFWETFPPWPIALLTFLVCGFLIIWFLGAKGFCTYACPYGAIFGVVDRLAPGRIRVTDACEGCGHCTATCTSKVVVHQEVRDYGMVVDDGCMKCMDCVSVCPTNALYFGFGKPALLAKPRREDAKPRQRTRRPLTEELLLGAFFVAAFLALRGLYDSVPFLLALGCAVILAFFGVVALDLVRRGSVRAFGGELKAEGSLTPRGRVWAFGLGLSFLFTAHSGFIRWHDWKAETLFEEVAPLRGVLLDGRRDELTSDDVALGRRALAHTRAIDAYGLFDTAQNDVYRAWFALLADEPDVFEEAMTSAAESPRATANLHYDLGRFYVARGRGEEAAAKYRRFLELEPRVGVFDELARLEFELGRQDAALGTYERAVELAPANPDLHFNHGMLQAMVGRKEEAYASFATTFELDDARVDALDKLFLLARDLGRHADLAGHARALIDRLPADAAPGLARIAVEAWVQAGDRSRALGMVNELEEAGRLEAALADELRVRLAE